MTHYARYNEFGGISESVPAEVLEGLLAECSESADGRTVNGWRLERESDGSIWAEYHGQGRTYYPVQSS